MWRRFSLQVLHPGQWLERPAPVQPEYIVEVFATPSPPSDARLSPPLPSRQVKRVRTFISTYSCTSLKARLELPTRKYWTQPASEALICLITFGIGVDLLPLAFEKSTPKALQLPLRGIRGRHHQHIPIQRFQVHRRLPTVDGVRSLLVFPAGTRPRSSLAQGHLLRVSRPGFSRKTLEQSRAKVFRLVGPIRQPIVRFERDGRTETWPYANQSIPVKLILRTNRLIGFIEGMNRGIIQGLTQIHAPLGLDLGTAEPSPCSAGQQCHRPCNRPGGLVDEALFFSGLPLFVSHHARCGLSAPLGDHPIGCGHAHC